MHARKSEEKPDEKKCFQNYSLIFSRDAFKWQNLFGASQVAKSSASSQMNAPRTHILHTSNE